MQRKQGRLFNELRPFRITYDIYAYAAGSALFELGDTKVLTAVTLQQGVPQFLRGKKTGWLTAEYGMLPASTPVRTLREGSTHKRNGRTIEIARMIGRSLRSIIDLSSLGERTIFIDCDVLQADGSTRTACITSAYCALRSAQQRWLADGTLTEAFLQDEIVALSAGLSANGPLLDIDYAEDSDIIADYNFVLTRSGNIIEIQGISEGRPISWQDFEALRNLAQEGLAQLAPLFESVAADQSLPPCSGLGAHRIRVSESASSPS